MLLSLCLGGECVARLCYRCKEFKKNTVHTHGTTVALEHWQIYRVSVVFAKLGFKINIFLINGGTTCDRRNLLEC